MSLAVPVQSDWLNSAFSPAVYGDIALSINTQYNTMFASLRLVTSSWLQLTHSYPNLGGFFPNLIPSVVYLIKSQP